MAITNRLSRRTSIREVVPEVLPQNGSAPQDARVADEPAEPTATIAADIERLEQARREAEAETARARRRAEAARQEAEREESRVAALREETSRLEAVLREAARAEVVRLPATRPHPLPATAVLEATALEAVRTEPVEQRLQRTSGATCTIRLWRGYRKANFYAAKAEAGEDVAVAESPQFRARGTVTLERTDEAAAAHAVLVEKLDAQGWQRVDTGTAWFEAIFER